MSEKVSAKRKVFIAAVLFLILVVLPAGSWYYLSKGLSWRKTAQSELKDYGKIRKVNIIYADGTKEDMLKEKVCVLHYFGANPDLTPENRTILDIGERLYQQFGFKPGNSVDHFRLVMISEGGTADFRTHAQTLPSADFVNWVWTGGLNSWNTIMANAYDRYVQEDGHKRHEYYFGLTDTTGTIRCFYNALDEKEVGRMVEHIALLLPKN